MKRYLGLICAIGAALACIAAVNVVPPGGGTVNVDNWIESTNAFSGTALPLGQVSFTNASGNIVVSSVTGVDANLNKKGLLLIDPNGSDRTLTVPAAWRMTDGGSSYTVTNGTLVYLSVECWAGVYTNGSVTWVW